MYINYHFGKMVMLTAEVDAGGRDLFMLQVSIPYFCENQVDCLSKLWIPREITLNSRQRLSVLLKSMKVIG